MKLKCVWSAVKEFMPGRIYEVESGAAHYIKDERGIDHVVKKRPDGEWTVAQGAAWGILARLEEVVEKERTYSWDDIWDDLAAF